MKNAIVLILVSVFGGSAGTSDEALAELVRTETAFVATCARIGVRDSFLQNMSPDVVRVSGEGIVHGVEDLKNSAPEPESCKNLVWLPTTGDISAGGDLGYLTGPLTIKPADANAKGGSGVFFSIWRKGPSGWKVVYDGGVGTPQPVAKGEFVRAGSSVVAAKPAVQAGGSYRQAEEEFVAAARRGYADAIKQFAAEHLRLIRPGRMPTENKEAALRIANDSPPRFEFQVVGGEAAASDDLAYAYGNFIAEAATGEKRPGSYVRVWKRVDEKRWLLAVEVLYPRAPPRPVKPAAQ